MSESATSTMTADDFITGVLAGLALHSRTDLEVVDRRFDRVLGEIYNELVAAKTPPHVDIDFQISPDPIHGDSAVVQEALAVAVTGRLLSRVNPTFRRLHINLSPTQAASILDGLPGGRALFDWITEAFENAYFSNAI